MFFLCKSPDHVASDCPFRQKFNNEEFKEKKKRKLKEEIMVRLEKLVSKSTIISSNEKSIEIHNILETNEAVRCVFEVLMTAHESCS